MVGSRIKVNHGKYPPEPRDRKKTFMIVNIGSGAGPRQHRFCHPGRVAPRPGDRACGVRGRRFGVAASVLLGLCVYVQLLVATPASAAQQFRSDEWITECEGGPGAAAPDCSVTVPFWQTQGDQKGSFALVVMLQTGNIGIVGQPFPIKAVLRVDRNPPIECRQTRYCIFATAQALAVAKQLEAGSLILVDVMTERSTFRFSLTPKGYQAGIAKIRAWGYRVPIGY